MDNKIYKNEIINFNYFQGFGAVAGVFGWSRSRHFGPAPAPPYIFVK